MINILELDESMLYVENERWQCDLGPGDAVKLGLVFEAVDLVEMGHVKSNGAYSVVIDSYLMPQPEFLDEEIVNQAADEGAETREEIIREVYLYYGGVPVNIDLVQPAKASCGFSSFVADSSLKAVDCDLDGAEVRHFKDVEEALRFARDFYAIYANGLFAFIERVLDNPLRTGETGWDRIRLMTGRDGHESRGLSRNSG